MSDPILLAKRGSWDAFLAEYDPASTPTFASPSTGETVLFGALANRDPAVRYAIANRLLDDGADPRAETTSGSNLLPVLLSQRAMGEPTEAAAVLARLLEGGADVNRPDDRKQAPLAVLYNNYNSPDASSIPLYDVLFARPDLDLDAPASKQITVRELLDVNPDNKPELQQRARAYEPRTGDS